MTPESTVAATDELQRALDDAGLPAWLGERLRAEARAGMADGPRPPGDVVVAWAGELAGMDLIALNDDRFAVYTVDQSGELTDEPAVTRCSSSLDWDAAWTLLDAKRWDRFYPTHVHPCWTERVAGHTATARTRMHEGVARAWARLLGTGDDLE